MLIMSYLKTVIKAIKFNFEINQSEIASRIGVTSTYLSDVINERVPLSELFSDKLQKAFSINPGYLLTGEGDIFLQKRDGNITKLLHTNELKESQEVYKKSDFDILLENNTRLTKSIEKIVDSMEKMTIVIENNSKTILQLTTKNSDAQKDAKCADVG